MANNAAEESELVEKRFRYVERLVYDLLVYSLTKCGLPKDCLPTTVCDDNSYNPSNYIESAGLRILTTSLSRRETWKQIFTSRHKSYGFYEESMKMFITKLVLIHQNELLLTKCFIIESSLALSNELILFLHNNKIGVDFNTITKSVSEIIVSAFKPDQDISKATEGLYINFDDISVYNMWITYFITKYAIPYGARNDLRKLFWEYFTMLWKIETVANDYYLHTQINRKTGSWKLMPADDLIAAIKNHEALSKILTFGLIIIHNDGESPNSELSKNDHGAPSHNLPLAIGLPCIGELYGSENSKETPEVSSKISKLKIGVPCESESCGSKDSKTYCAFSKILKLGIVVPCVSAIPDSGNIKNALDALTKILPLESNCSNKRQGID